MNRDPVTSTSLKSIGYDPNNNVLEVEFIKGSVYEYSGVSQDTYDSIMTADSIGSAFSKLVKSGGYVYKRVD